MTYAHLPNAPHIDRVLAHMKDHPEKWVAALDAAWSAAWTDAHDATWAATRYAAWGAAWDATWDAEWDAEWDDEWDAARDAARDAAWGAIAALIAWDDASVFLDQDPDAVRAQAAAGNHAAVLLLPAAIAMQGGTP